MRAVAQSAHETAAGSRRVHVVQGQFAISNDPDEVLTTILGSCVAACIRDPVARIGGMNHFLLPGAAGAEGLRYGVNAMELLVNGLLQRGAARHRLEAKVFGGARVVRGLSDIGEQNAEFALKYFEDEGITCLGGSLGGVLGRRLQYWPSSGRSRQLLLPEDESVMAERQAPPVAMDAADGGLELF